MINNLEKLFTAITFVGMFWCMLVLFSLFVRKKFDPVPLQLRVSGYMIVIGTTAALFFRWLGESK